MPLRTPLCDLLGCRYPVVQTAMGWVAGPELVAATTNAGGFGFLAGATIAAERIEADILRVKQLTGDAPFGLNFHMFQPNAQQLLDLAVKHKIRAVSYGRGPDKKVIRRLRDAGIVCMPTVGALKHDEIGIEAAIALGDDHAFKGLDALAVAFDDIHVDDHGVARRELGHVLAETFDFFFFQLLDQIHAALHC